MSDDDARNVTAHGNQSEIEITPNKTIGTISRAHYAPRGFLQRPGRVLRMIDRRTWKQLRHSRRRWIPRDSRRARAGLIAFAKTILRISRRAR